jgi:hypothetical protein
MGATNKLLVAGVQQRDMNMAFGLLSMLFMGAGVGGAKAYLRGEDPTKWDPDQWLLEGIDRSGLLGVYNPALNGLRYVGSQMGYGEMPSRYIHRGAESVFLGPTLSQIGRAARLGTAAIEGDTEKAAEHAQRLTPYWSNTLHFRQLMQRLGE